MEREFKNIESPFTELFSLLKRYENIYGESPLLTYNSDELQTINQHVDNAMKVLLQGLQGMSQLIGVASSNKKDINELSHLGFFISAISNLTEALNDLKSDADYVLSRRGAQNY